MTNQITLVLIATAISLALPASAIAYADSNSNTGPTDSGPAITPQEIKHPETIKIPGQSKQCTLDGFCGADEHHPKGCNFIDPVNGGKPCLGSGSHHHHKHSDITTTTIQQQPIVTAAGAPINLQATIETSASTTWSGFIMASKIGEPDKLPIGNLDISGSGSQSYYFPCTPELLTGGMKGGSYYVDVHIDTSADNPPLLKVSVLLNGQVLNSTTVNADSVDATISGPCSPT